MAYLPVSFISHNDQALYSAEISERLSVLHKTISRVLSSLSASAVSGFRCETKDGHVMHWYFAVANYCADVPEAKDMLGILHGNRTKRTCFRCLSTKEEFSIFKKHEYRNLQETRNIRLKQKRFQTQIGKASCSNDDVSSKKDLQDRSMTYQECFLENFPFVGISESLDLYQVCSYEPLRGFHIGVSKLLKLLVYERLSDCEKRNSVLGNRKFSTIRSHVLTAVNEMISRFHTDSFAPGLFLDLVSRSKGKKLNGLFTDNGIRGFVEAKNMKGLNRIFPFVAAFIDRCCGESEEAPTTMVAALYRDFQKSQMNTLNFHMLDHLVDDLRRNGGLKFSDSCLYEHSHVKVKQFYRETSKRKDTALKQTIESYHKSLLREISSDHSRCTQYKTARSIAHESTGAAFVRDGRKISVQDLRFSREYVRNQRKGGNMIHHGNVDAVRLVNDAGEDGTQAFIILLGERYEEPSKIVMTRVFSAYVAGGYIPLHSNVFEDQDGSLLIELIVNSRRISQRTVSCKGFHGRPILRQDCVMIEKYSEEGKRAVWIGKVLALLRIKDEDLVLVKYFDTIQSNDYCMVSLRCVNLRWARN